MNHSPRCIVVGAGIVGSAAAWHLQRAGAQVTLIDPEIPGQSTSFGNAGCLAVTSICPSSYPGVIRQVPAWLLDADGPMRIRWSQIHSVAPWLWRFWRAGRADRVDAIVAAQASLMSSVLADYDEILLGTDSAGLRRSEGMIMLYGNEAQVASDQWQFDMRRQYDLPWQRLSKDELRQLEPDVQLGEEGVAILDPDWQHLISPADVTAAFADAAVALGANWHQDRVKRVELKQDDVVAETISGKRIEADYLVLAAGVWSNELLKQLNSKVPLAAKRGYHSMLRQPNVSLTHPLGHFAENIVVTPMRDGLRITGMAEFARIDAEPDYRLAKVPLRNAQRFLPGLAGEEVTEWMGQRPMLPDGLPVLGCLPADQRVICAFGHGHYGVTQAPTTGRIVSDLVFGRDPHIDLSPFSISRF
jgi:D-amino-acid dehydrogenase